MLCLSGFRELVAIIFKSMLYRLCLNIPMNNKVLTARKVDYARMSSLVNLWKMALIGAGTSALSN